MISHQWQNKQSANQWVGTKDKNVQSQAGGPQTRCSWFSGEMDGRLVQFKLRHSDSLGAQMDLAGWLLLSSFSGVFGTKAERDLKVESRSGLKLHRHKRAENEVATEPQASSTEPKQMENLLVEMREMILKIYQIVWFKYAGGQRSPVPMHRFFCFVFFYT